MAKPLSGPIHPAHPGFPDRVLPMLLWRMPSQTWMKMMPRREGMRVGVRPEHERPQMIDCRADTSAPAMLALVAGLPLIQLWALCS